MSPRSPSGWLKLEGITRNNLHRVSADILLGVFTAVTGVSSSGKSSLVSQALIDLVSAQLGHEAPLPEDEGDELESTPLGATAGHIAGGMESNTRLVRADQKPIGRTPRSNLAAYTGFFDHVPSSSRRPGRRARAATTLDASRSMWPRAAARHAKAKAS